MNALIEMALRRQRRGTGSFLKVQSIRFAMKFSDLLSVPFAIVGDQATKLYMPERFTLDWDLLVHEDDEDQVRTQLRAAGAEEFRNLNIPGFSCRLPEGIPVDVLLRGDPWILSALREANRDESGEPVLDLPWLILLKLEASRVQDLADISRMLACANEDLRQRCRTVIERWEPASLEDFDGLLHLGKLEHG
jgi:hypothetical protein